METTYCPSTKRFEYFDSHAHLTSESLLPHLDPILARAREAGVARILNICTDPASLAAGLALASRRPEIQNAGATTPHDVATDGNLAFPIFEQAALTKQIAAVGETGLDYHYEHSPQDIQKAFLIRYLHLSAAADLPIIFHCRDAFSDLFAIADLEYPRWCKAILHCFTGTLEEAYQVLERGWYLSLSGIVTFKKSGWLRDIACIVPLSQLLIETDAPYLAPQKHRGKPNEPAFLVETAECIAAAKGLSLEEIARATFHNAKNLIV